MHVTYTKKIEDCVLVLLSSYNGESYISDQLDSLVKQIYPVFVIIRDDGSTDNTVNIIESYQKRYDNIKLIKGENVGFKKSFDKLLSMDDVNRYEFISFCDQDDIWLPDKIDASVRLIRKSYDENVPTLYFGNQILIDKGNNVIYERYFLDAPQITKYSSLICCCGAGCTMLFNQAARLMYLTGIKCTSKYHDYQMYLVCMYMGKIVFDEEPHMRYRIHDDNAVGLQNRKNFFHGLKDIAFQIITPRKKSNRIVWLNSFLNEYEEFLMPSDKLLLKRVVEHETKFAYRLFIFFNPKFRINNNIVCCSKFSEMITVVSFKVRVLFNILYGYEY